MKSIFYIRKLAQHLEYFIFSPRSIGHRGHKTGYYEHLIAYVDGCLSSSCGVSKRLFSSPQPSETAGKQAAHKHYCTLCTAYPSQYSLAARQAGTVTHGQTQDQTGTGKRGA